MVRPGGDRHPERILNVSKNPPTPTPPDFAAVMRDLLEKNPVVVMFVLPRECRGLDDFPPDQALRIDVGHAFDAPPMNPRVTERALEFEASFRGRSRAVVVPWDGVLFAGSPANFAEVLAQSLRLQQVARRPAAGATSNVVQVDFRKKGNNQSEPV